MSKRKVTEVNTDTTTNFSFYLLAGSLAAAFLFLVVYIFVNV